MNKTLTFSRATFSEATATEILERNPRGISIELSEAATALIEGEIKRLRQTEKLTDPLLCFNRVAQTLPSCTRIVAMAAKDGFIEPEALEEDCGVKVAEAA